MQRTTPKRNKKKKRPSRMRKIYRFDLARIAFGTRAFIAALARRIHAVLRAIIVTLGPAARSLVTRVALLLRRGMVLLAEALACYHRHVSAEAERSLCVLQSEVPCGSRTLETTVEEAELTLVMLRSDLAAERVNLFIASVRDKIGAAEDALRPELVEVPNV